MPDELLDYWAYFNRTDFFLRNVPEPWPMRQYVPGQVTNHVAEMLHRLENGPMPEQTTSRVKCHYKNAQGWRKTTTQHYPGSRVILAELLNYPIATSANVTSESEADFRTRTYIIEKEVTTKNFRTNETTKDYYYVEET